MSATENGLKPRTSLKSLASFSFSKGKSSLTTRTSPAAPDAADLFQAQGVQVTREKCKAAALGALVADCATSSSYWLSSEDHQALVSDPTYLAQPEFFEPRSGKRLYIVGGLSVLGDELLPFLQSMVHHGGFDGVHSTQTSYEFLKHYNGEMTELAKRFVAAVERGCYFPVGGALNSLQCLTKVPPIVARYAGKPELVLKMKDAVKCQQSSREAVSASVAASKILERVVLGSSILEALSWAQEDGQLDSYSQRHVQTVLQSLSVPHAVFVAKNGKSEKLPGAFLSSLHAAALSASFEEGIRETLRAGGATCGRAHLVGALLAAQQGQHAIPERWSDLTAKFEEYNALIDKLVSQRAIISIMSPV